MTDKGRTGWKWHASAEVALAAVFTVAAGAVHLAVAAPHFIDSVWLGAGFLLVGWSQLAAGGAVLAGNGSPRTGVLALAALNVVAVTVWVLSRTVGLPVGHPGPEPVTLTDLTLVSLEVVAIVAAVRVAFARGRERSRGMARGVTLVLPVLAAVGAGSVAIATADAHGQHSRTSHHATAGENPRDADHGDGLAADTTVRACVPACRSRPGGRMLSGQVTSDLLTPGADDPGSPSHEEEEDGHRSHGSGEDHHGDG